MFDEQVLLGTDLHSTDDIDGAGQSIGFRSLQFASLLDLTGYFGGRDVEFTRRPATQHPLADANMYPRRLEARTRNITPSVCSDVLILQRRTAPYIPVPSLGVKAANEPNQNGGCAVNCLMAIMTWGTSGCCQPLMSLAGRIRPLIPLPMALTSIWVERARACGFIRMVWKVNYERRLGVLINHGLGLDIPSTSGSF